jgi:hypothetical protein
MARLSRSSRLRALSLLVVLCASGCQLIADFDRSKIPTDAGPLPDASFSFDAGLDAQLPDGALDGAPPFDSGSDAPADAAPGDDAGNDDAGNDDAG